MKATVYLCVCYEIADNHEMLFRGYRTFSEEPWNVTQDGKTISAVVYQMSAGTLEMASNGLRAAVLSMATTMPNSWWAEAWAWINPSKAAHMALYDRIQKLRPYNIDREKWEAQWFGKED